MFVLPACIQHALSAQKSSKAFFYNIKKFLKEHHQQCHITPAQAILIYHIGYYMLSLSVIQKNSMYTYSNPAYNIRKLISMGHIVSRVSSEDEREILLNLTDKGKALYKSLHAFFTIQDVPLSKNLPCENHNKDRLYPHYA